MKLQQVNQCCCGGSLELGTKVIGWMQIVGSGLFTIFAIAGVVVSYSTANWELFFAETFLGYLSNGLYQIGFGIVLLLGVKRRRADYINTWVIASLFGIIIYILNLFVELVVTMFATREERTEIIVALVVISSIVMALEYYCLIVVYSFRKEILSGNIQVRLQEV